jgi:hypothetical protein
MVSYKASSATATISDLLCCPSELYSPPIHRPEFFAVVAAETPNRESGRKWRDMTAELCPSLRLSYLKGCLTCRKILRHGADGLTSPRKEVILRIFIALENPLQSAGFKPLEPWVR